jgi:gamma-glutamyltranspeptidase/glutathione hydrolase
VEPITTNYKGYDVWEIPPNGHGIVVLMALNILEKMDLSAGHDDPSVIHRQMEAMKLAFSDGKRYVADPAHMKATVEQLLSKDYAAERRALITDSAMDPKPGDPYCGDTVYLNAADGDGNMISYIQSIYCGFGSGTVLPGTGIVFHNRGFNFTMDESMENCVAPGKKPYHTIIPGFLTKDGEAIGPFGVMGGFMQPQGHVQVLNNLIDFHMNPQEALDAPRWMWTGGKEISLEHGYGGNTASVLAGRGHEITVPADSLSFGRGQIIWRNEEGVLVGATEPRTDGTVAVW